MATMDTVGAVAGALDYARSSIQAGSSAWQNTDGNFWNKLGAGINAGISELFTGNYQEQKELQSTIDAEQRSLDNTRALRDEENAYNSSSAQASRLKAAGINPMGSLGNPVAASTTQVDSSGGIPSKTGPASMSDLLPLMQFMEQKRVNDSIIDKNKAQAGKLTKETALAEWDAKLKEQMFNYNAENYPILIEAGKQKLSNAVQEFENLKANKSATEQQIEESKARVLKITAETQLLNLQKTWEGQINEAKLKQMALSLEIGKFDKEFAEWRAKNEAQLAKINSYGANEAEMRNYFLFGEGVKLDNNYIKINSAQMDNLLAIANQSKSISNLYGNGWGFDLLLYLATNILSAGFTASTTSGTSSVTTTRK